MGSSAEVEVEAETASEELRYDDRVDDRPRPHQGLQ